MDRFEQYRMPAMRCALAVLGLICAAAGASQPSAGRATPVRLAVFPFEVVPVTAETAYLSHALSDAISDQLATTPGLRLVSRQSVQSAHDAQLTRGTSARVLDADYILEGKVRPGTDDIAVELRLWSSALQRNEWVIQVNSGGPVLQQLPWQVAQRIRASLAAAPPGA